jgi:hypothetical protein
MTLSDGVVLLRPLNISDAQAHLAGEDDALIQWLNGGKGGIDTVTAHIERAEEAWVRHAAWTFCRCCRYTLVVQTSVVGSSSSTPGTSRSLDPWPQTASR